MVHAPHQFESLLFSPVMTGQGERTTVSALSALIRRNPLKSDTRQGKVRFGLPLHALRFYFPALWPVSFPRFFVCQRAGFMLPVFLMLLADPLHPVRAAGRTALEKHGVFRLRNCRIRSSYAPA